MSEYVWNFIAVTDKISDVIIDIKHPVRNGYSFIEDDIGASLILFTTVLNGPVQPNGTYKWDLQQVLDLKIPLPVWTDNAKKIPLLTLFLGSSHPLTTVTTLEKECVGRINLSPRPSELALLTPSNPII